MRFRFNIGINGELHDIEQGFSTSREFEEALDGGKIKIVLSDLELPIEQYSFVEIVTYEVDYNEVILDTKREEYLVISDEVVLNSKYGVGYYEHNLTLLEFTAKLDLYQKSAFQFSKDIFDDGNAKYEYILPTIVENEFFPNVIMSDSEQGNNYNIVTQKGFVVFKPDIKQVYLGKIVIPKVEKGRYERYIYNQDISNGWYEGDIYLRVDESPIKYIISDSDTTIELPTGNYELTVGITVYSMRNEEYIDYDYYKFYVEVRDEFGETMYDVIMQLRDLVSKYGGIESKKYFNETRLFALNEADAAFLKTVEAPQIYIPSATLRQTLIFILSYVNALPRLVRGFGIDMLSLEHFGKSLGTYILENITETYSEQNTNQIGTRSYAELHNILPNDLNNATTYSPYQNGYQTVRSTGIQLTDGEFELKLPSGKPMYKPIKFEVMLQYVLEDRDNGIVIETGKMTLDLTDIYINQSEWQLKEITSNFPNAFYTEAFEKNVGLDMYKTENIAWREGDTSIKLSDVAGTMFRSTLIKSVLKHEVNKFVTERLFNENYNNDINGLELKIIGLGSSDPFWYKNLLFNIEYITNENMAIKQDKEDLSQISFYSEIRHNQDENTISLARSSSKIYGDLQRTGNKVNTFTKVHTSLSDMYGIGQKDKDNYTITSIQSQYFIDYIITTYTVVKHHNRISQATFIDQTYRWRDNYASELKQRNETYNDYIFLLPHKPNEQPLFENTNTKIVTKRYSDQEDDVPYFYKVLFGNLGVQHPINETKATTALVRTDGTVAEANDGAGYFSFISTPISSAGFKGGLVFKIGFNDNQVAGDGLIQKDGNWYNQAVRYTDKNARIKYFDFYILNKRSFKNADGNETSRYPAIIEYGSVVDNTIPATNNDLVYFSTGNVVENETADDSLIVNKDPMSNFNLNYALNVMSYYYGLFIFGRDFFTKNQMISNNKNDENFVPYLYIYNNGTSYDIFEDIKVKSGYRMSYNLRLDTTKVFLTTSGEYVIINVGGLLSLDTSWAIGDENGNLIFASNENISQIEIVRTHIRPNVKVIGELSVKTIIQTDLSNEIGIIDYSIYSELIRVENELSVIDKSYIGVKYRSTMESEISIVEQVISSELIRVENGILATTNSVIGLNIQSNLYSNLNVLEYLIEPELIRVDNNFIVSNHIFIKDKFTSVLQSEVEVLEQNIMSELIRVENGLSPTYSVKVPTKTPTVSAIYCKIQSGRNNIFVDVTNNDENRVYLHKNGSIFGILEIGQTRSVLIQESNSLPNYFTVDIYVIDVNGNKLKSNTVTKSGTITYCLP